VTGQIDPVGGGYVLSANLAAAADGSVLTSVRETAGEPAELLGAIDRLSAKLRERIGESLVSIRANPPLEQVTTSSLAALRKYSEGSRQIDLGFPEGAIPVLEEAIALDTGFAMAYRKLAVAIGNSFGSASREAVATTRAYELRDRLPATERDLATAYYFDNVEHDPARVASAYRSILDRDPEQDIALNNLALLSTLERRYAEAESLAVRALRVGSASQYFFQALNAQVAQGRLVEARATLKRLTEFYPAGSVARLDLASDLALAERNYAVADSLNRQLREAQRASPEWQARTSRALAALAETRGRLAEAAAHHRDYMAVSELRRLPQDYLRGAAELAQLELRYRNRPAEALAIVQAAVARYPLDSLPPADRPYLELAEVHGAAGRPEQARRLLGEYERTVPAGQRRAVRRASISYGRVAEAEGKLAEAIEAYRDAYARTGICGNCGLRELAAVLDRQGQADSARAVYEHFVATPTALGRIFAEPQGLAASYKRLGELYEARGARARAAEYYDKFVDLWKDADPELQPGVKEIRARLARLAQEPGG
jgi:tetratricopeptide (TPR) repeat protein